MLYIEQLDQRWRPSILEQRWQIRERLVEYEQTTTKRMRLREASNLDLLCSLHEVTYQVCDLYTTQPVNWDIVTYLSCFGGMGFRRGE